MSDVIEESWTLINVTREKLDALLRISMRGSESGC